MNQEYLFDAKHQTVKQSHFCKRASGAQATARRDTDVRESGALNRLNIRVETGGRGGGGANSDLGGRGEAVENQAMGAPDLKSALRIVERANLPRRDRAEVRQDVMDQFRQPTAKDTSGLSNAGKEKFSHDMTAWTLGGMVGDQPDPSDPKYQKRTDALGGAKPPAGGGGGASAPAPAAAPAAPTSSGKSVSLKAAMALPQNRGKTPAQVQADIQSHGYAVTP